MEKDVLERLYRRHAKAVYLYLYSLCHNPALSEDLTQETFLRALCSLELSGTEVLPWLLTVAKNLYLDTWRKEKRMIFKAGDTRNPRKGDIEEELEDAKEGILDMLIQKERNRQLYQAIQKLKSVEREAVVLYYFAGLSQEEIGRLLQLSYGNTRVILYRAKRKLKSMLTPQGIAAQGEETRSV